jgi:hypothetical protein
MQRRLFSIVWLLVALLMLASMAVLPEQVGDPGHEMGRGGFVAVMLGSLALAGGLCSPGFVVWLGRAAPSQINLPHADYWLAAERREASLERLGEHFAGIGLMVVLLLGGVHLLVLLQGRPDWPQLPREAWALAGTLLGLWFAVWMWQAWRLFPAPPNQAAEPPSHPRRPGGHR